MKFPPVDRPHREDCVHHSNLRQRIERLRYKATGSIVVLAGIEGCQRENVKGSGAPSCCLTVRLTDDWRQLWVPGHEG